MLGQTADVATGIHAQQHCRLQDPRHRISPSRPSCRCTVARNAAVHATTISGPAGVQHDGLTAKSGFTPDSLLLRYAPPNIKFGKLDANKLLSRAMLQAQSFDEVEALWQQHHQHFNSHNFSILLTKLQQLQASSSSQAAALCSKAARELQLKVLACDAHCIVTAIYTLAKLRVYEKNIVDDLLFACMDLWDTMTPIGFSNLVYALGLLQHKSLDRQFVFQYFKHVPDQLPSFNPQALSIMLYGLALLGLPPPNEVAALVWKATDKQLEGFSGQGLSIMMWSCAKLRLNPPEHLMGSVLQQAAINLPSFTVQGLSLTMWASVKLGCRPALGWWKSAEAAYLQKFDQVLPQHLTMTAYAMWKGGHTPSAAWTSRMYDYSSTHLDTFKPLTLVMLLYCCVKLKLQPPAAFMRRYLATVASKMDSFSPQLLSLTIWSLAKLQFAAGSAWVQLFLSHSQPRLCHMTCQDLSMTIYALATLEIHPGPTWLSAFCSASEGRLGDFLASHMGKTLHSFAVLGYQPSNTWWAAYSRHLKQRLPSLPSLTLLDIIWAASELQLPLTQQLEEDMYTLAVCTVTTATSKQLLRGQM